jgi:hypothetical protein
MAVGGVLALGCLGLLAGIVVLYRGLTRLVDELFQDRCEPLSWQLRVYIHAERLQRGAVLLMAGALCLAGGAVVLGRW